MEPTASQLNRESAANEALFNSDSADLRILLHDDVWKLVADELQMKYPNEVENLLNSSPFFHNLLTSKRSSFLFEKVFELVGSTVWKTEGLEGLPVAEVLKCRRVCKQWNVGIDKLIPEKFQHFPSIPNGVDTINNAFRYALRNELKNYNRDAMENKTQVFLNYFERTHGSSKRNPFVWRDLNIRMRYPGDNGADQVYENYKLFLAGVCSVLTKYGNHVETLDIHIDGNKCFQDASKFQHWLLKTPNLKKLIFHKEFETEDEDMTIFKVFQESHPLPQLKYLNSLMMNAVPQPAFNQLQQNSQITILDIGYWKFKESIFNAILPNLKTLIIENEGKEIMGQLRYSLHSKWPLTSLSITFMNFWMENLDACVTLFNEIQDKFATTLVSLELKVSDFGKYVDYSSIWEACGNRQLNLPNLKNIIFHLFSKHGSLDFLLPMRNNLEVISVELGYKVPYKKLTKVKSGTIIQFVGFETNLFDSNIWAIFKKLKTVEVTFRSGKKEKIEKFCYSRDEWMKNNLYS